MIFAECKLLPVAKSDRIVLDTCTTLNCLGRGGVLGIPFSLVAFTNCLIPNGPT